MRAGQGTQGPAVASEGPPPPSGKPRPMEQGDALKVALEFRLHWRIFSLEGWWNLLPPRIAPSCQVDVKTWAGRTVRCGLQILVQSWWPVPWGWRPLGRGGLASREVLCTQEQPRAQPECEVRGPLSLGSPAQVTFRKSVD